MDSRTRVADGPDKLSVYPIKPLGNAWLPLDQVEKLPEFVYLTITGTHSNPHGELLRIFLKSRDFGWVTSVENTFTAWENLRRMLCVSDWRALVRHTLWGSFTIVDGKVALIKIAPTDRSR